MPFDTPEQALLFDLEYAVKSFKCAPPPKSHTAAMSDWKDLLAKHIIKHLERAQWEFRQKDPQQPGPAPSHMPLRED